MAAGDKFTGGCYFLYKIFYFSDFKHDVIIKM